MKRVIGLFIYVFFSLNLFGQKIYLKHPVYIDILEKYIYVVSKSDSSVITNQNPSGISNMKVFDFKSRGGMKFVYYDSSINAVVKGQYKDANKLSPPKGYRKEGVRVIVIKGGISQSYYNPLRAGIWYYYDISGGELKKEVYRNGVLLKE